MEDIFQGVGSEEEAMALIDQLSSGSPAPDAPPMPAEVGAPSASVAPPASVDALPAQIPSDVPTGIVEAAGQAAEVAAPGAADMVEPRGPSNMLDMMQLMLEDSAVNKLKQQADQRPEEISAFDPASNTLPAKLPVGTTGIHPDDYSTAVQALAGSFGSMNEIGMLLDPQDRVGYSLGVMNNRALRSDVKAQLIDQVMRDGKIVPEALGKEWYEARNIILQPYDPEVQG